MFKRLKEVLTSLDLSFFIPYWGLAQWVLMHIDELRSVPITSALEGTFFLSLALYRDYINDSGGLLVLWVDNRYQ